MMKKLHVLLTLLAAFASFGCGSDEPATDAPAKAPTATSKASKNIVKTEKLSDGSIVETDKDGMQIITHPDGSKSYKSGSKIKLTETKPGDTIHHFSK